MKNRVLEILEENRGDCVSGEKLSELLGVSRAAVNKAVRALREQGYRIEAASGRGYCLAKNCDKLSEAGIRRFLTEKKDVRILIFDEVSSTNILAKDLLRQEADGALLLAERQSAGRGRMGRSFFSPQGTGIYMSIGLHPKVTAEQAVFITVAAAVAVSRAIDALLGIETQIKWVNDIYYKGRKVCGILTEASFEMESGALSHAVVGIGINLHSPEGGFPAEIAQKAGALSDCGSTVLKNRLVAEVANQFNVVYRQLDTLEFLEEYRKKSCLIGKKVMVIPAHGETKVATALAIDERARLIVQTENGETLALSSGDVSIVPETC